MHNQHFAVPDELTIQVSDGPFREVRLWYDGHGAVLAALGVALSGAGERLAYTWVGLRAVEDQVEAWTSCSSLTGTDQATAAAAFAATLVAGAFRDAVVLEHAAGNPTPAARIPHHRRQQSGPERCIIRYLARRQSERGPGWGCQVSRRELQDAGVLKRGANVTGYFVTYHKGQRPDPERLQRLAGAGIITGEPLLPGPGD